MPKADFFHRLGVFAVEHFFDAQQCARLRAEMQSAGHSRAAVGEPDGHVDVDLSVRRVGLATMSKPAIALVTSRLLEVKPKVENHFRVRLAGCQPLQFLRYRTGDFYRPHHDNLGGHANFVRERQISVIIFVNSASDHTQPDCYVGGSLTFYGLFDDPKGAALGLPLEAEEGLLVAFPSDMLHSVVTVTSGERYTIATWFV